jgi:hypothetical protein
MNRLVAWLIFPHQTYLFKQTSLPGVVVEIFFFSLPRQAGLGSHGAVFAQLHEQEAEEALQNNMNSLNSLTKLLLVGLT